MSLQRLTIASRTGEEDEDWHPARLVFSRFDGPSKGREPVPILLRRGPSGREAL